MQNNVLHLHTFSLTMFVLYSLWNFTNFYIFINVTEDIFIYLYFHVLNIIVNTILYRLSVGIILSKITLMEELFKRECNETSNKEKIFEKSMSQKFRKIFQTQWTLRVLNESIELLTCISTNYFTVDKICVSNKTIERSMKGTKMVVDSKEIVVVDCQAENQLLTRIHARTIRAWIRSRNFEPFEQRIVASYVRILCTHVRKHASLLTNRKSINW